MQIKLIKQYVFLEIQSTHIDYENVLMWIKEMTTEIHNTKYQDDIHYILTDNCIKIFMKEIAYQQLIVDVLQDDY